MHNPALLRRWIGWVTLGEGLGFLIPLSALAISTSLRLPALMTWMVVACCGAGEGALLALGQTTALRRTDFDWPAGSWIGATAGAASIAWAIGMLPSTLTDIGVSIDFGEPAVWVLVALGGILILITIPVAQFFALRTEIDRAWRWVPVNVVAWLVGMTFTFLPGPFIDEGSPVPLTVVCFVVAGLAMALTVAIVTGYWMQKFLAERAEQLLKR